MEIFKLFGRILIDSAQAESSISKTGEKAEGIAGKLGKGIQTAAKWGTGIAAGAAAAGAAIMGVATKAAAATDDIDKMSQKIGISREAYQEMAFAMSQSGTDVSLLQNGVKTLTNQMQSASEGGKIASDAFAALGLSIYDSNGKLKDQEKMMFEAMSALQGMDDQTQKAALAVDLFGRAGTELMPMLNGAAGSIDEMRQKAHDLGLVISDDAVDAGVQFTDTMDQLKRSFSAAATNIGVELMPIIMSLATWITDNMPQIQAVAGAVFTALAEAVSTLVGWLKSAIDTIRQWAAENQELVEKVKGVFEGFFTVVEGLFAAFRDIFSGDWKHLFSETLPKLLKDAFRLIGSLLSTALDSLVSLVKGIGTALFNAGKGIFTSLWDGIKSVWENVKDWVSEKINWLKDKLMFWKSGEESMDKKKASGSHAAGLPFVPYDGYIAELHRGESVVNASDVGVLLNKLEALLSRPSGGGEPVTIVVQSILDGKMMGESVTQYQIRAGKAAGA